MSSVLSKSRIESFSDIVFGLALSIGALSLIGRPVSDAEAVTADLVAFGYSFLILTTVWLRYTSVATTLPIERPVTLRLNLVMLLLVAIEPYLFNLVFASPGVPTAPFSQFVSALFGLDLGGLFAILAAFDHLALRPEAAGVPEARRRNLRTYRNRHVIGSTFFLASALPWFGTWLVFGTASPMLTVRELFWILPVVIGSVWGRAEWILRRQRRPGSGTHDGETPN